MKQNEKFINLGKDFWANVRLISQQVGYTIRGKGTIKVPSIEEMILALRKLNLETNHLVDKKGVYTKYSKLLYEYFQFRADILHVIAEPNLMNVAQAEELFNSLYEELKPSCPIPMNKQKGNKKTHAFFTSIINMLIESNANNLNCNYDPRELTTVTKEGKPLRTLARRVDGAFPSVNDPIAIWEIKEYYYTTTFGSRVADGVYETLLDGMELEELQVNENIDVKHYLMIDAHYTWWSCGKSYLCRIVDMLHMGYVDEVLIGKEVIERLPELVSMWVKLSQKRSS